VANACGEVDAAIGMNLKALRIDYVRFAHLSGQLNEGLARLGLQETMHVVIVSDHGMTALRCEPMRVINLYVIIVLLNLFRFV
jgi:hypothetical protein